MEVLNTDAITHLPTIADNSYDLVILDPNYQDWQKLIDVGFIEEAVRVMKPTGNLIAFTKQPFDFALRSALQPWFRREIAWTFDNGGAWCSPKMPLISSQKIYWCVKSKDFYFNPRTGQPYSNKTKDFKRKSKVFGDYQAEGRLFTKDEGGLWLRDHLHFNKPNSGKIPAKPQELIDILVACFSPSGGTILDPFCGSGTTIKSAEKLGRDILAIDIEKDRIDTILNTLFYLTLIKERM